MISKSEENFELLLAEEYVRNTSENVFLTGKAGTGKTTFLRQIKDITDKKMIITAPTGVAAINAGGVTLHSFFQLPLGPLIPGDEATPKKQEWMYQYKKKKKQLFKEIELLVIDEISMVRADLLDGIDTVLRINRANNEPFGGVQLLMIGDLHQLSPVIKKNDMKILEPYYRTGFYFFSSHALNRTRMKTIELNHIYRQSDDKFIKLLNQVRDNQLDADSVKELNKRFMGDFSPEEDSEYITMTTHNKKAQAINEKRLLALSGPDFNLSASVSGTFPEYAYPAPINLRLKPGAQVMFLRNDTSHVKRYYNGKIGKVTRISDDCVWIKCSDQPEEITVEPMSWENVQYSLNSEKKEIEKNITGTFKQFPIKLAWAITIHKSQGLTFQKAAIDINSAFAHGQVYVALSRCQTLEGVILSSPIPDKGAIKTDLAVKHFMKQIREDQGANAQLQLESLKKQQFLTKRFDFTTLEQQLNDIVALSKKENCRLLFPNNWKLHDIQKTAREQIFSVSEKFKRQLSHAFSSDGFLENDTYIKERALKGSSWFTDKLNVIFNDNFQNLEYETGNKRVKQTMENAVKDLRNEISYKISNLHPSALLKYI